MTDIKSGKYAFEPFSGQMDGVLSGDPIKVFPVGTFYRGNRKLDLTPERLRAFAANIKAGLPRFRVPINENHSGIGKVGTVSDLEYFEQGPKGPGLYATKYELTAEGRKLIEQERYDAVSGEAVWTLNGAQYQDPTTGKYHDNVLVGLALTAQPFFGHDNVALFSADPLPETMADNSDAHLSAMRKAWAKAKELMSGLVQLFDGEWLQDLPEHKRPGYKPPEPDMASAPASADAHSDGGPVADTQPAAEPETVVTVTGAVVSQSSTVSTAQPYIVTTAGTNAAVIDTTTTAGQTTAYVAAPETAAAPTKAEKMSDDESEYDGEDCNPHQLLMALEAVAGMADEQRDNAELAGPLTQARDALKRAMAALVAKYTAGGKTAADLFAQASADLKAGEALALARKLGLLDDAPAAPVVEPFRDYSKDERKAMAEKGEALPDGSFPIATVADLKAAIQSIGRAENPAVARKHIAKRAKALDQADLVPPWWNKGDDMSVSDAASAANSKGETPMEENKPVTELFTAEEFAALKAQAAKAQALEAQVESLKTQAETMSAYVVNERKARRRDQLTRECEQFHALGVAPATLAEKFQALEEKDAELFGYFRDLLAQADKSLMHAGLFSQVSSARGENAPETFEAVVDKILAEKFGGDVTKAAEAMIAASKLRPDLQADYLRQTR